MGLPPGPIYVLKLVPRLGLLVGGVVGVITYTGQQLGFNVPAWVSVPIAVLALPCFRLSYQHYLNFADDRNAKRLGAVRPPVLKESSRAIIGKLTESILNGYPADTVLDWIEECGPAYRSEFPLLGSRVGIFNADGEMWKFHRAITRPFFTRERISDFDIYDKSAKISLKLAISRLSEGYSIECQDLVSRFTLDSATEFLFGHTVDSLSAGIPYPHVSSASLAFTEGQTQTNIRSPLGKDWPLVEFWGNKIAPLRKRMDEFIEPVMNEALRRREERLKKGNDDKEEEEMTLLAHLVNHTQDPTILKDELVNLLVAGRNTASPALATFVQSFTIITHLVGYPDYHGHDWILQNAHIPSILPKLTGLKSFSFQNLTGTVVWKYLSPGMSKAFQDLCLNVSITHLDFSNIRGMPVSWIAKCQNLSHLRLKYVSEDGGVPDIYQSCDEVTSCPVTSLDILNATSAIKRSVDALPFQTSRSSRLLFTKTETLQLLNTLSRNSKLAASFVHGSSGCHLDCSRASFIVSLSKRRNHTLYMLTQHPEIEAHLREQIFDKVGPSQRPTYEAMRDMRYLQVLRLYPPVPFDSRTSTNSPVLLAGQNPSDPPTYISANTGCVYTVFLMHRREDLWGPDAL
ncbi:hypothetical protein CVT24_002989 [Panaeolus cyanescens]|uniref:Cytochrome P450 n=1 Tax=Panaeolus cyanescens TaxID=181874 RepID=A0A409YXT7_9AGAR|nr:hypothetical protein CVT24_002989 [Panaeolus cyanescens]